MRKSKAKRGFISKHDRIRSDETDDCAHDPVPIASDATEGSERNTRCGTHLVRQLQFAQALQRGLVVRLGLRLGVGVDVSVGLGDGVGVGLELARRGGLARGLGARRQRAHRLEGELARLLLVESLHRAARCECEREGGGGMRVRGGSPCPS